MHTTTATRKSSNPTEASRAQTSPTNTTTQEPRTTPRRIPTSISRTAALHNSQVNDNSILGRCRPCVGFLEQMLLKTLDRLDVERMGTWIMRCCRLLHNSSSSASSDYISAFPDIFIGLGHDTSSLNLVHLVQSFPPMILNDEME